MIKSSDFLIALLLDAYVLRPESSDYFLIRYAVSPPNFGLYHKDGNSLDCIRTETLIYKVK